MKISDTILKQLGISFVAQQGSLIEYRLDANGMKIVLAPDPTARIVAVVQHYNVGSRHEGAGNTGYSHLLEHMLFKGTPTFNAAKGNSYDDFMKRMGGVYNATTWLDRTNYFAKVPSAFLEQYLAYEADRMRNAIIIDADLATEMPVVVDEFDIGENDPDQILDKQLDATVFTEHPYKVSTIGARSEVMKVTAAALKEKLYEVYYHPNNSTLIIVGGFDVLQALGYVVRHYGKIRPSKHVIPVPFTVEPKQFGERRFVVSKAGDLPRVMMGFHVPCARHEDKIVIAALTSILSGSRASRLHQKLVNSGLVSAVEASSHDTHDAGVFKVYAKLTPGTKPQLVEKIILAELARVADTLVTKSELDRAKTQNRNGTVHLRTNKLKWASSISENEACADWQWGESYDNRFELVTAEQMREVAQRYLTVENRTVGYFLPKAETAPVVTAPKPTTFEGRTVKTVLTNGLTVLLMPTDVESAIGLSFTTRAGSVYAPADKGVVAHMVAKLLTEGSNKYSKKRIAELSAEMLVQLRFGAGTFRSDLSTHVVPADLTRFLDLLSDVLRNPLFRQDELNLLKTTIGAELEEDAMDPADRAATALTQALYPEGSPFRGDSVAIRAAQTAGVTVDDLRAFHAAYYSPKATVLTLVGKFDPAVVLKTIESKFGKWEGGDVAAPQAVHGINPTSQSINVNIVGKDNLTTLVGVPVQLSVTSADYLAAAVANKALGGDTLSARLGKEIREKRGLTYGVSCSLGDAWVEGGLWAVRMTTSGANLGQAVPLISQLVAEFVRDGIGEAELELERAGLINAFVMSLDAPVDIARTITMYEASGRGVAAMDSYEQRAMAVTKADVDAALRKHFRITDAVTVIAGTLPDGMTAS